MFDKDNMDTVQFMSVSPSLKSRLLYLLVFSETSMTRFWVGLCSLGWAVLMTNDNLHTYASLNLMLSLAPWYLWVLGFSVNGISLIYGVVKRQYSTLQLWIEPLLGFTLWTSAAISHFITQGVIGPISLGAAIFFWLLVRYPTHNENKRKRPYV
jgi:hypothetical protein